MRTLIGSIVLCGFAFTAVNLEGSEIASDSISERSGAETARSANSGKGSAGAGGRVDNDTDSSTFIRNNTSEDAEANSTVEAIVAKNKTGTEACDKAMDGDLAKKIEKYQSTVDKIFKHVTQKKKGETWRQLAEFVDDHGPRFTGTMALEHAIDNRLHYFMDIAGSENVNQEPVQVPIWLRGETEVKLLNAWAGSRNKTLKVLTLGFSVGTPSPEGLTAEAVVVKSFDELESDKNISGKIVVFNQDFVSYDETVIYREEGASRAAAKGAVAALIRSVTDYSLYTPHTGMMTYTGNGSRIPAISITVEDAELLWRKQQRGETLEIFIRSTAGRAGTADSRNLIAELPGKENPDEFVLISGHIDSWDVGQGAMDDGGGAAITWRTLEVLKELSLKPRRTVKAVLFTAEELGSIGGKAFYEKHRPNASYAQFILESDLGAFSPLGLSSGVRNEGAKCIIKKVLQLFQGLNATALDPQNDGPDIEGWFGLGVPGASLLTKSDNYFRYHHTEADTMSMMDPAALDNATAMWASVAFVLADLDAKIPHDPIPGSNNQTTTY